LVASKVVVDRGAVKIDIVSRRLRSSARDT
jgi:hypothetical protein